jgi:hypothetical protein
VVKALGVMASKENGASVVGLGALADFVTVEEHAKDLRSYAVFSESQIAEQLESFRREVHFQVEEFAILADGRRLVIDEGRGFGATLSSSADPWSHLTAESIQNDVLTTVLPDDGNTADEHPWEWLAQRLGELDVSVTPDELRELQYEVVFSDWLRERLRS